MIITDDFVMINFPKTGSTFVRNALKKIFQNYSILERFMFMTGLKRRPYFENLWLTNIRAITFRKDVKDEHGVCIQIPKKHASKKIISIKRNLFERYISAYEYGDWKKTPWVEEALLKERFESYPDLSFEEYVTLLMDFNPLEKHPNINRRLPIGPASCQFILFYFKEPFEVLKKIDEEYLNSNLYKKEMYDVQFLDQSNLNLELYFCLQDLGYEENDIKFIQKAKKQNISTPNGRTIKDYFSHEALTLVKEKERFLFKIFNDYYV